MILHPVLFLVFGACHLLLGPSVAAEPASFRVSISAPWFSDPALEALEQIASYNATTYHRLLPVISPTDDLDRFLALATDRGLPKHVEPLIKLSHSLRISAPRIHALYAAALDHGLLQAPSQCSSFVVRIDTDIITCDMEHIHSLLETSWRGTQTPVIAGLDQFPYGPASSNQSMLLFANPLDPGFAATWDTFTKLPARVSLRYIPRNWRHHSQAHSIPIYGYHTHLQVKNTEYKVTDDREILVKPAPGPRLNRIDKDDLTDLTFKVVQNVSSLDIFASMTQDYPRLLPDYDSVPVNKKQAKALKASEELLSRIAGHSPAHILINSQIVPTGTDSVYSLLKFIDHENRLWSLVNHAPGIDWDEFQTFLTFGPPDEPAPDRFDYCSLKSITNHAHGTLTDADPPALIWLNDLENDEKYAEWPKSLDMVLSMIGRGLRPVARNLFNVVVFLDLSDDAHCQLLEDLVQLITQGTPIRVGIVPIVTRDLSSTQSGAAIKFVINSIEAGPQVAARAWPKARNSAPASTDDEASKTLEKDIYQNLLTACLQFNVSEKGEMMFNGQFLEFSVRGYHNVLGQQIQGELENIGRAMYSRNSKLSEETDLGSYPCQGAWKSRLSYIFKDAHPLAYSESTFSVDPVHVEDGPEDDNAMPYVHVSIHGAATDVQLSTLKSAQANLGFAFEPIALLLESSEPPSLVINGRQFRNFPKNASVELVEIIIHRELKQRILPLLTMSRPIINMTTGTFWRMSSLWWWNKVELESILPGKVSARRFDSSVIPACKPGTCLITESVSAQPLVNMTVILHPLSNQAQKLAPILLLFHKSLPEMAITIIWRTFTLTSVPDRFTRFVGIDASEAEFTEMPAIVYTLAMDTPPSWVVMAKSSELDLDNLIITMDNELNTAKMELESFLVEGHAQGSHMGESRGMQLTLSGNQTLTSTIVMANLGYFQFKARPGMYTLRLRPGRTTELYVPYSKSVVVQSYDGVLLFPEFGKQAGKETQEMIEPSAAPKKGLVPKVWLSHASSLIFGPQVEKVHVFTVASGHLYERFLAIMMQSVVSKASRPVKFWLLGDFLSPSFIRFLPHLAKEIGFDYQLLSYNWPDWLRDQDVKQRKIWGYKILFLDVLFPLENGPDRIIFVDADQVVRADLVELMVQDMDNKVYGFTPFCNTRPEMDGYRFWQQGFWQTHLRGKPYHISALYVVDLQLFRARAAGDILRMQYQTLSADPNSLANLDQDLPNYLQHMLEIYSLPQEWLWCETWCSDASLASAKTIDLCNNPMTREPKLDRARRLLPEWSVYDARTEAIRKRVAGGGAEKEGPKAVEEVVKGGTEKEGPEAVEEVVKGGAEKEGPEAVEEIVKGGAEKEGPGAVEEVVKGGAEKEGPGAVEEVVKEEEKKEEL